MLLKENNVIRMEKEDVSFALFNLAPAPLPMTPYASSLLSPLTLNESQRIKTHRQTLWT